ncbi:hypothetical protein E6C76_16375 [Pseudothauera nasutitermitis]|uniref:Uncharacterized protein n=1 Tax=Pseudothauera nasutitermitis TaxID=2565930 RepID=A0A4S4ASL9_9RHOO|nr:hypothetical protein [Pseudothauera nasutitermitis]THF62844.1 hypothetical protein E6C76_16375 [Pseudothauera nasutitermitis]
MVIVMDMSADNKPAAIDPAPYDDEVLDAGWLPRPEIAPRLQEHAAEAAREPRMPPPMDVEAFLAAVYRNQE